MKNNISTKKSSIRKQSTPNTGKAKNEAQLIIAKAKKEVDEIIDELKELKRTKQADYKEHEVIAFKSKLKSNFDKEETKISSSYQDLQPGNLVKVLTLNRTGELIEKVNESEWLVQIGILTSRINQKIFRINY